MQFVTKEYPTPKLNLTQHDAAPDQVRAGVREPADKERVRQLLTFDDLPNVDEIAARAAKLAEIARESGHGFAMIGGAPFLMSALERALIAEGVRPLYAFSKRESEDVRQPDGSVRKTQVFRHAGWVNVPVEV